MSMPADHPTPGPPPSRVRYAVLALLALAPACAYLARGFSAFNTTVGEEFGVSNRAMGDAIAGFALGYLLFQVPGGLPTGALGARVTLPLAGVAWSLCACWGSLARSPDEPFA